VRDTNVLDPMDVKTLAQFSLIGDPSIHPVRGPKASVPIGGVKGMQGARKARRANLLSLGLALEESRSYVKARRSISKPKSALKRVRDEFELPPSKTKMSSYRVQSPPALTKLRSGVIPDVPDAMHVLLTPIDVRPPSPQFRAIVAAERAGDVVWVRELYSR
jgi:hypothetical protein